MACHALSPAGKTEFDDLKSDVEDSQRDRYAKAVCERWPDLFGTRKKAEWRQILLALADQNIERLNAKLEVHEQNAGAQAERTLARLSFDFSPEGEALRKHLIKCTNGLFRGMATYRKYKNQAKTRGGWGEASGAGSLGTVQDSSEDAGHAAHQWDGSELAPDAAFGLGDGLEDAGHAAHQWDRSELEPDAAFGLGDGLDDRLEHADVIDSDGVKQHERELGRLGAIGENAPSEANSAETMSIVEAQESIQVTANSGALPGLDNGAAQPGERSTQESGKAQGSGSESGNPKPKTPDSSNRACGTSLPPAVSKREQRRLQRQEERRAVEKMVEDMLTARNCAPGEIQMSALRLPFSAGGGP